MLGKGSTNIKATHYYHSNTYVSFSLCSPEVGAGHVAGDVEEHQALQSLRQLHHLPITLQRDLTLQIALAVGQELLATKQTI